MKEFVIDIKNLVVKHWGKLIIIYLLGSLILNFGDFIDDIKEGWNAAEAEAQDK
jgi:hypothetical protein